MEKISNKPRYSIDQGIKRQFKLENMSPQIQGLGKNLGEGSTIEGCLHRTEVIARIQKMFPHSRGYCKNQEGCLNRVEVIVRI